jgi:flavodoxin
MAITAARRMRRNRRERIVMGSEGSEARMNSWKVLTVFYSRSGITRECARLIHERVGGDLVELVPEVPYPEEFGAVVEQAKRELTAGYRPALRKGIEDIEAYDVVFIGSPNWWDTVAPPVMTFLGTHDLAGKASVPFITHGGGGAGRSIRDITALCPDATVVEGLVVRDREVATAQPQVVQWLRRLGM